MSYFYSYLNEQGRAGFVMSSQASSAGRDEAKVRQKLVETGDVGLMIAIRSNFFYTRTVPCELWFLNRNKPKAHKDKVLMLDARNVYRKVTRKIYDFSPEQEQNLLAIVWLYRGEADRYLELVSDYLGQVSDEAQACIELEEDGAVVHPLPDYLAAIHKLKKILQPLLASQQDNSQLTEQQPEFDKEYKLLVQDIARFHQRADGAQQQWENTPDTNAGLLKLTRQFEPLAETSRDLIKQTDLLYKLATRLIDTLNSSPLPEGEMPGVRANSRDITRARKAADEARVQAVEQLKQVRYFWRQAHWLTERFPQARLRDVEGLVKLVDRSEIEANDWSLTPGRYVGVAPEEEDEGFDFEETLRDIHVELEDLNAEAVKLAATIKRNFEELGI
ncbi:Type I restriction-modification system, DNA-methyltransferase subunit M [hydrothermal vent metagenome]|uniref:Type I restriction-modification system, DNA-methyltransferase subunit M n=1 Tax=hydrothermal vent metagenome TaxID=652676 RepID=A0A3B1BNL0_9ZZZZ